MKTLLAAVGAASLLVALGGAVSLWLWANDGLGARAEPSTLEARAASLARRWVLPTSVRRLKNPVASTAAVFDEASVHWADHCALCHGNDGKGTTAIGSHLYPRAPDMTRAETQSLSDGELYHAIQNGIRLSGMPAWGEPRMDDATTWALVAFIRHLPSLSTAEKQRMEKLNPRSRAEAEEEADDAAFLRGTPSPHSHGVKP